jgi:prepilin peptidase CpaA
MTFLPGFTSVALAVGFAGLVLWAAFSDFTRLIIPNRICAAIVALYPAHVIAAAAPVDWQAAAWLAGAAFAAGTILFALRLVGGGDVKLLTAVILWAGPALLWPFLVVTVLAGGVLALSAAITHRYWRTLAVRVIGRATGVDDAALPEALSVPYGVAIAAGGMLVAVKLTVA